MRNSTFLVILNAAAILLVALFFVRLDGSAKEARRYPPLAHGLPPLYETNIQLDAYGVYKSAGLWGVQVVHLNRFLNMVDYFPKEESHSTPFPIPTRDIRPLYEKGIESHNWLFIANRTGMVRSVAVVLPEDVFRQRRTGFMSDFAFSASGDVIRGYTYDMSLLVTTLESLPPIQEPVVVNVDAGYFSEGVDPRMTAQMLRMRCPDVRMVILSESVDEPEVNDAMRERLALFQTAWTGKQ